MTEYLEMMKGPSIINLLNKVCRVAYEEKRIAELKANDRFAELLRYIGEQWVFGEQLGVENAAITD